MKRLHISNFGLKILSLILALLVWLYIVNEIQMGRINQVKSIPSFFGYEMTEKRVEVKPNIIGQPIAGFVVDTKNIIIDPKYLIVIGPKKYLRDIEYVYTEELDISEFTKDIRLAVKLSRFVKGYVPRKNFINIVIPIQKA